MVVNFQESLPFFAHSSTQLGKRRLSPSRGFPHMTIRSENSWSDIPTEESSFFSSTLVLFLAGPLSWRLRAYLLAAVFDLWSWNIWRGTHIYILFWAFWCIKRWNRLRNGQVSEIDLQYWPQPPSCRFWPPILKHVKRTHIYILFWAFWCIKRLNRLRKGQVSEIDLPILTSTS